MSGQRLPASIIHPWIIFQGGPVLQGKKVFIPPEVSAVFEVIKQASSSNNPSGALNLGMRRLKQKTPTLTAFVNWLSDPQVYEIAQSLGVSWTIPIWHAAIGKILAGSKAHKAFGLDAPGKRRSYSFSDCENIALYFEHRRLQGDAEARIMKDIQDALKNRAPDRRTIRDAQYRLTRDKCTGNLTLSPQDLADMAKASRCLLDLP
jgi:hypothetical protein